MKKLIRMSFILSFVFILTACFKIPVGEGNYLEISREGFNITDSEGTRTSFSIDEETGFSMQSVDSDGEQAGISLGQNLEVPDALPTDIPIMDDANIVQSSSAQGNASISYSTETSIEDLDTVYRNYVNSSAFDSEPNIVEFKDEDEGYLISMIFEANQSDGQVRVSLLKMSNDEDRTNVHIVYGSQEYIDSQTN